MSDEARCVIKYMVLIYSNPTTWMNEPDLEDIGWREHMQINADLAASGELVSAEPLEDPVLTRTIRVRDGEVSSTDGPFAETKEFLAGYYLVDCENIERAVEIAARMPDARVSAVEVRPVMQVEGLEM